MEKNSSKSYDNPATIEETAETKSSGFKMYHLVAVVAIIIAQIALMVFIVNSQNNNLLDEPIDVPFSKSGEVVTCKQSINKDTKESFVDCDWDNIRASSNEEIKTYKNLREAKVDERQCVYFYHSRGYTMDFSCRD